MKEPLRQWLLGAAVLAASLLMLSVYARRGQLEFTLEFVRAWLGLS